MQFDGIFEGLSFLHYGSCDVFLPVFIVTFTVYCRSKIFRCVTNLPRNSSGILWDGFGISMA
jgi:hypothetical protein